MTYREVFTKLSADLSKLNHNELTLVSYKKESHSLIFRQVGVIFIASYLSPFYLPLSGFKFGILTQNGLAKLEYQLSELLKDESIDDLKLIPDLRKLGTSWYRLYTKSSIVSPQEVINLNYCNITSKFWTWLTCRFYNANSRILYKVVSSEYKHSK